MLLARFDHELDVDEVGRSAPVAVFGTRTAKIEGGLKPRSNRQH
jgi:hypothetical protein